MADAVCRPGTAPRLAQATLGAVPAAVAPPSYDRAAISPGIVHIGPGAFCRAHLAVYTEDVLARGARDWGIVGVDPLSPAVREALQPQDHLYTLLVREPEGDRPRVVGSLCGVLGPDEREAALQRMADPRTRIVTLTVTEKGYCQDAATGALDEAHPAIRADLAGDALPRSVPGLLAEAIRRRRAAQVAPFTVLVCDNLSQNGAKVRRIVSRFATLRDPDLGKFVADSIAFPCTMVDRITPATKDEDRAQVTAAYGYVDAWPVVTEPFRQWVIEDNFPGGRPAWDEVGAIMARDVHPFEVMKLRCLNGAHSALAYIGVVAGLETVADGMDDADLSAFVRRLWRDDLVPTVPPVPGTDIVSYTGELEQRFRNPAIRHRTIQIAMDGSQKLPPRLLDPALERLRAGADASCIAFVVAAWIRFLAGCNDAVEGYAVSDPMADRLLQVREACNGDTVALVDALFAIPEIFGPDIAAHAGFKAAVVANLRAIRADGMRRALAGFLRR
ncbi:D-mannonate oxidoreductase [Rhodovastum atsumiense]|uniref:Mannitol dehydrogenase family protein n=1 Tax=Rhodovastum atsumiense TaxID=504468 RepID=A0A5M6IQY2_9PROT|nr:mannitol dehydrogenase family protein [Rhodovastum atsumiense]KAA5610696.1 mannitol dehydrogenase family protein [Rhodovastum atsumiense]CAH2603302.1 D-mannonate oxidoreductase [Rhodovastum atsumiense]